MGIDFLEGTEPAEQLVALRAYVESIEDAVCAAADGLVAAGDAVATVRRMRGLILRQREEIARLRAERDAALGGDAPAALASHVAEAVAVERDACVRALRAYAYALPLARRVTVLFTATMLKHWRAEGVTVIRAEYGPAPVDADGAPVRSTREEHPTVVEVGDVA